MAIIEAIESHNLEVDTASITFSSLAGYEHLELIVSLNGTRSSSYNYTQIQLNGDTGNNYSERRIHASGGNLYGQSYASNPTMFQYENATPATGNGNGFMYAQGRITFYDYLNANKNTTVSSDWGTVLGDGTYGNSDRTTQVWDNTAAVTSIKLMFSSTGLMYLMRRGSSATLYGIKSS